MTFSGRYYLRLIFVGFSVLYCLSPQTGFAYENGEITGDSVQTKDVNDLVLISGVVKNRLTEALLNWTNVTIQGTTEGVMTDNKGHYTMNVPKGSTIVFSYVGYVTERIRIFNGGVYNVDLRPVIFRINLPEVSEDLEITSKPERSPKRRVKQADGATVAIEEMPNFAYGGFMGLALFIKEKTQIYVDETNERGSVKLGFTITSDGNAIDPFIIFSSNNDLNQVAKDIITGLRGWIPGKQRGVPVNVKVSLEMKFR